MKLTTIENNQALAFVLLIVGTITLLAQEQSASSTKFVIPEIQPGFGERVKVTGLTLPGARLKGCEMSYKNLPNDKVLVNMVATDIVNGGFCEYGLPDCPNNDGHSYQFSGRWKIEYGFREYSCELFGDPKNPLLFVLNKGTGLTYVSGNGSVTLENGKKVQLPNSTSQDNPPFSKEFLDYKNKAEQNDAKAQYYLSTCYAEGRGVKKNIVEAYAWSYLSGIENLSLKTEMSSEQIALAKKRVDEIRAQIEAKLKNGGK